MPRPRPENARLVIVKGIYRIEWWDGDKRRRKSVGTADRNTAVAALKAFAKATASGVLDGKPAIKSLNIGTFLYVMANASGSVKIGVSINPPFRMAMLQNANGGRLKLVRAWLPADGVKAMSVEREVFKRLAEHRALGEWFDVTPAKACTTIEAVLNSYL